MDRFTVVYSGSDIWYLSIYLDGDKLQSITTHEDSESAIYESNFSREGLSGGVNKLGDFEFIGEWLGRN